MPNKKHRKSKIAARVLFYALAAFIIFLLSLEIALRNLVPVDTVKSKIITTISTAVNGTVEIDHISSGLLGVELRGVSIFAGSERIVYIKRAAIFFTIPSILSRQFNVKHIIVRGLEVNVVRGKNGVFNFDSMIPASFKEKTVEEKKAARRAIVKFLIQTTQLESSDISFIDKQNNIKLKIKNLGIDANDLDLEHEFRLAINTHLDFSYQDINIKNFKFGLTLRPNLDAKTLSFESGAFVIEDSALFLDGFVKNFDTAPEVNFNLSAKRLLSASFKDLFDLPEVDLSSLQADGHMLLDVKESNLKIEHFNLNTIFNELSASGDVNFKTDLHYNIHTAGKLFLDKMPLALTMAEPYKPEGQAQWSFNIKDMSAAGTLDLSAVGGHLPFAGTLKNINTHIDVHSLHDIKMPVLSGYLNGHLFHTKLSYLMNKDGGEIDAAFDAKRVFINSTVKEYEEIVEDVVEFENEPIEQSIEETQRGLSDRLNLPPFKIRAYADVRSFDGPFFNAENIKFNMNVSNATVMMDKIEGFVSFSAAPGTIKDVHSLAQSNHLMRVMFMSVSVVSKVINSLNIVDVFARTLKQKADSEDFSDESDSYSVDGKMDFDSFNTYINFNSGVSKIKKSTFVAPMLSFEMHGDIDFKTRALEMSVNAAPGRHKAGGVMPLTVKVDGTIDEPKGSVSVLATVGELFKDVFANPITGLFKSADKEEKN